MSQQVLNATNTTNTSDVKRNLGRMDLMSIAIGQTIGAGIMAMTGTAIGMTGRSVNIAFIFAGIITILAIIPQIYVGGTARFKGGQYTQVAAFGGQKLAGIFTMINIFIGIGISMYVLSFTEYFVALVPNAPSKIISMLVITIMFGLNLLGTKQAAKLQTVLCVAMAAALGLFVAFGVGEIQPGYFRQPGFMTSGVMGLLVASSYLSFAAGGATYVINFSGEAKNPTKDIPFVIIVSTIGVSILYALIGTIAGGVLPVEEVANKSLSLVAESIMPKSIYIFFIVGGAMFSLLTTLNASIGWITRPVVQAANDGWLPKFMGNIHPKFKTPANALLLFYIIGIIPIMLDLDISIVSSSTVILTSVVKAILAFITIRMPFVMPELWKKSKFYISDGKLKFACILGGLVATLQVVLLVVTSSSQEIIGNITILVFSIIYAILRNKKVKMEVSYE